MAKFRVTLTDEERCVLRKMVSSGKGAARNCSMAAFCCRRMRVQKACGMPTKPSPRRWV